MYFSFAALFFIIYFFFKVKLQFCILAVKITEVYQPDFIIVVLPDCLGPVTVITVKYFAASVITLSMFRCMYLPSMFYANSKYNFKIT